MSDLQRCQHIAECGVPIVRVLSIGETWALAICADCWARIKNQAFVEIIQESIRNGIQAIEPTNKDLPPRI